MRPLRKFERRLEKLFEGAFTKAFRGGVHPLEIARVLMREVDDGRVLDIDETLVPNGYQVSLSPRDLERLEGYLTRLASEMESLIINYANQNDYRLLSRPRLSFIKGDELKEGEFEVRAYMDENVGSSPVHSPAAGRNSPSREARLGVLTFLDGDRAGMTYELEAGRTKIGRSEENDIVLANPMASRYHAEVDHLPEGYVVRDLGSTNGTLVGGRRVGERLLQDGDTLVIGETKLKFNLIGGPDVP
jgi:hypothetical protein